MTPIFFIKPSSSSNNYPSDHYEDHLNTHQFLTLNSQDSKPLTTHLFLNSNVQNEIFNTELQPAPQYDQPAEASQFDQSIMYDTSVRSIHTSQSYLDHGNENNKSGIDSNMKWVSSKMRVMLKMKKSDHPMNRNSYSSSSRQVITKIEDHKQVPVPPSSTMEETDHNSSNSSSSNNSAIPIIRVCSDCNTSKTPLWRSGPQGPKSLCNACGIRQRKARRALAAAAAAAGGGESCGFNGRSVMAPLKVVKSHHKEHRKPGKGHVTKYKKRQYSKQIIMTPSPTPSPSPPPPSPSPSPSSSTSPSSSPVRKNCVEEFLESLSKNLKFYHVLPQDEKEAAILLMALSSGYAH